jgi:hypothetical protein
MHTKIERLILFLTLCFLLLSPTQWTLRFKGQSLATPADLLLLLTCALGFVALCAGRLTQRLGLPSPFATLFVVFAALSVTAAQNRAEALKELVQWGAYFIGGWMLLRYLFDAIRLRGVTLALMAAAAGVVLLAGLVQTFHRGISDMDVRAFFGNRNVLAGFLALALPFAYAQTLVLPSPVAGLVGLLIAVVGIFVVLSGAAAFAILLAFMVMASMRGRAALGLTSVLVLFSVLVLHPNTPRYNEDEEHDPWLDSISLHDSSSVLSRRYPDWECGALMMLDHPVRGVGAGNYQERISNYRRVPTPAGAPEPDVQNLYLVLAASIGMPGLLMFIAMLLEGVALSGRAAAIRRGYLSDSERALALGCFGALLAYMLTAIWHPLLVRGLGIPLIAVLALVQHLHVRAARNP